MPTVLRAAGARPPDTPRYTSQISPATLRVSSNDRRSPPSDLLAALPMTFEFPKMRTRPPGNHLEPLRGNPSDRYTDGPHSRSPRKHIHEPCPHCNLYGKHIPGHPRRILAAQWVYKLMFQDAGLQNPGRDGKIRTSPVRDVYQYANLSSSLAQNLIWRNLTESTIPLKLRINSPLARNVASKLVDAAGGCWSARDLQLPKPN